MENFLKPLTDIYYRSIHINVNNTVIIMCVSNNCTHIYIIFTSQLTNSNVYFFGLGVALFPVVRHFDTIAAPVVVLRLQRGKPEGEVVTQSLIHFGDDSFDG